MDCQRFLDAGRQFEVLFRFWRCPPARVWHTVQRGRDAAARGSMIKLLMDGLGWVGAFSVVLAYACVSFRKIRPDALLYQVLNVAGGLFLALNTAYYHAYPSAFVNLVWISIALAALARIKGRPSYEPQ